MDQHTMKDVLIVVDSRIAMFKIVNAAQTICILARGVEGCNHVYLTSFILWKIRTRSQFTFC